MCKSATSNTSGTFTVSIVNVNGAGTFASPVTLAPGQCSVVAEDQTTAVTDGSNVTVKETSAGFVNGGVIFINAQSGVSGPTALSNPATYFVNSFHGYVLTFNNNVPTPPPAPVCDFITFGRLVTTVNGEKVVISGNAGGNAPGGGILGEFHIDINGVDYHVSDISTYGPITSGALSGAAYPNARIVTGTAKNGATVELRLYDGGEPGKNTDLVYVKINGVVVVPLQTIDQGNMQYHSNCRGPKD